MATHLVNARVLAGEDFVDGLTVRIEGEHIAAIAGVVAPSAPRALKRSLFYKEAA